MNLNQYKSCLVILTIVFATLINAENSIALTPIIDSITPNSGPNASPTEVIINGSNFEQGANVSLLPGGMYIKGSLDEHLSGEDVYVSGNYAYVAAWTSGLRVIDISTPSIPVIIGSVDTPEIGRASCRERV